MVLDKAVTPPATLGRWSCRKKALTAGVSKAIVQRLWATNDIKPHLSRTFKLFKDKQFETKFWDLNPPEKALINMPRWRWVANHHYRDGHPDPSINKRGGTSVATDRGSCPYMGIHPR